MIFPHPLAADPEGLLAIGGDLSSQRLILAYQFGIFPWYAQGQEILWWSPDPRCVLFPRDLIIHKSMARLLRKGPFRVSFNRTFHEVIRHCQQTKRRGQEGTWITEDMITAYLNLHHQGYAHSIEVWQNDDLVGGLYGISLGKVFFGESMFSLVSDASKYGFIHLVQYLRAQGCLLIDCQQDTPHLRSLGALPIPRIDFMGILEKNRRCYSDVHLFPEK